METIDGKILFHGQNFENETANTVVSLARELGVFQDQESRGEAIERKTTLQQFFWLLEQLEKVSSQEDHQGRERLLKLLKKSHFEKIKIDPELSDEFGLRTDIEDSFERWFNFFSTKSSISISLRYYIFRQMIEHTEYNQAKGYYEKRAADTRGSLPDYDEHAVSLLAQTITNAFTKKKEEMSPAEKVFFEERKFGKLYGECINTVYDERCSREVTEGEWVEFDENDIQKLTESLQGQRVSWCVKNTGSAKSYLSDQNKKVFVYYSNDNDGAPTVPRIIFSINEERRIHEIEGVLGYKSIESSLLSVLEKVIEQMRIKKDSSLRLCVQRLRNVHSFVNRSRKREVFGKIEIEMLHDLDERRYFGNLLHPEVKTLLSQRDKRSDMAKLFECAPEEVSLSKEEVFEEGKKVHVGDVEFSPEEVCEKKFPRLWYGTITIKGQGDIHEVSFPDEVRGGFYLRPMYVWLDESRNIHIADSVKFPCVVSKHFILKGTIHAPFLKLPQTEVLNLASLENIGNLEFPLEPLSELNVAVSGGDPIYMRFSNTHTYVRFLKDHKDELKVANLERLEMYAAADFFEKTGQSLPKFLIKAFKTFHRIMTKWSGGVE
jgi:hypothetical protein